jgi:hypothetical protein
MNEAGSFESMPRVHVLTDPYRISANARTRFGGLTELL